MSLLSAINQAPAALLAAMPAAPVDPVLGSRAYRTPGQVPPGAGSVKSWGALTLLCLRVVALCYLIALLPGPLRALVLLFAVFIVISQCSYWLTLSPFMTLTDLCLALTLSGDHRVDAISSFFQPIVFRHALPYALVLSPMVLVPSVSGFRESLALRLLPRLYLLTSNYLLFLYLPERGFHLHPPTSLLRSALSCTFEGLRKYRELRDDRPDFYTPQGPWIGRLPGTEHNSSTGCGVGRFDTRRQGDQ